MARKFKLDRVYFGSEHTDVMTADQLMFATMVPWDRRGSIEDLEYKVDKLISIVAGLVAVLEAEAAKTLLNQCTGFTIVEVIDDADNT